MIPLSILDLEGRSEEGDVVDGFAEEAVVEFEVDYCVAWISGGIQGEVGPRKDSVELEGSM